MEIRTADHKESPLLGDELARWLQGDDVTLGSLIHLFGERAFALAFVILLTPSALPIPTGGVTHLLQVIAVVLAAQLLVGRQEPWLPRRWQGVRLAGDGSGRMVRGLLRLIRRVERLARPRGSWLFGSRVADGIYGVLVILGAAAAFVAPPFSGLDTLPSLGVVVLSLAVLFRDALIGLLGVILLAVGITLEVLLGAALFRTALHLWPW